MSLFIKQRVRSTRMLAGGLGQVFQRESGFARTVGASYYPAGWHEFVFYPFVIV